MAVYVDALRDWGWKLGPSCHLYADSNEELHAFAARLGLRRAWFQKKSIPHYDLTASKRQAAVRLGAVEHSDREMAEHRRRWAADAVARVKAARTEQQKQAVREELWR